MTWATLLGVYGAGLSSLIAYRDFKSQKGRLKVTVAPGIKENTPPSYVFRISNPRDHPIHLYDIGIAWKVERTSLKAYVGFMYKYRRWPATLGYVHHRIPGNAKIEAERERVIGPMQSYDLWVDENLIKHMGMGKDTFIGTAQDALGRNSFSKPYTIQSV